LATGLFILVVLFRLSGRCLRGRGRWAGGLRAGWLNGRGSGSGNGSGTGRGSGNGRRAGWLRGRNFGRPWNECSGWFRFVGGLPDRRRIVHGRRRRRRRRNRFGWLFLLVFHLHLREIKLHRTRDVVHR
jgi:hypothetical protein